MKPVSPAPSINLQLPLRNDGGFGGDGTSPPTFSDSWRSEPLAFLAAACAARRPAVAVSGGADSLCLAMLAKSWGDPLALIVDHGLRPGSADEAQGAAGTLARMGIPARILTVSGLGHGPGLASRARAARYQALTAAARAAGRVDLWLGHHRRDQAETVLMRRAAASGAAGLAGMARIVEGRDVRLLRPLLGMAPGDLRATLRAAGIAWAEDPGNADRGNTRGRLRGQLDDEAGDGPRVRVLAEAAAAAAARRVMADASHAAELAARASLFPEGYAVLTPGPVSPGALSALIRTIGGAAYPPATGAVAALAANPRPAVLAGVRVLPAGRLGPGLLLVREAAAVAVPVAAVSGALWDRRFLLEGADGEGLVGALGGDAASLRRLSSLPAAVLAVLPALRVQGALVEVPHLGYASGCGTARMAVSFAPASPASGARFGA